jgi:two-component system, NarL family, nitrate/nitrite response regulator NarL
MNRDARGKTVLVVAHDSMQAARVEAALRDLAGWRIDVCARQWPGALGDDPQANVVIAVGETAARRVLRAAGASPRTPVIIALVGDPARLWTSTARGRGLRAALSERATPEELVGAVRAVHAGLLVLHPEAVRSSTTGEVAVAAGTPLTAREREIVELLADGASNRSIAARLAISRHTAKFHVASILAKLGARSRAEAVALALRRGMLEV